MQQNAHEHIQFRVMRMSFEEYAEWLGQTRTKMTPDPSLAVKRLFPDPFLDQNLNHFGSD